ncbi:phosphatidylinositol phosphatase PTPRQ [Ceratobasidium sp. AG-Ba]|nr:phosphatidylinositol phosphatase PTPRQ [Ceratobasidium sp. AG-Ba]
MSYMLPSARKANIGGEPPTDDAQAGYPSPGNFKWCEPTFGDELGRDSQIWEIYVEETDRSDKELVKEWNDSLDVLLSKHVPNDIPNDFNLTITLLLVFAALFSAITTALVIESSHQLQPDPSESSAQTLLDISRSLVAISNGQPVDQSSFAGSSPPEFSPSRTSVAINALWFLSLGLSVAVSLVAMLSKSWCIAFMSKRTGPKYEQGRRRQLKWAGIERWGMQGVFVYLPALMHLALLLFAVGLAIYLWDMNKPVAYPVMALVGISVLVYVATTLLPLICSDCPYSTPLSKPLKYALDVTVDVIIPTLNGRMSGFIQPLVLRLRKGIWKLYCAVFRVNRKESEDDSNIEDDSEPKMEIDHHDQLARNPSDDVVLDDVACHMLLWLIDNSEDQRLVNITLQSLAGACRGLPRAPLVEHNVVEHIIRSIHGCFAQDPNVNIPELKPSSSLNSLLLYTRALSWLMVSDEEYGYPFDEWAVENSRLTQVFAQPKSNKALMYFYWKFTQIFFYSNFGMDDDPDHEINQDTNAAFISMVAPTLHQYQKLAAGSRTTFQGGFIPSDPNHTKLFITRSLKGDVFQTEKLSPEALLVLLEAVPHCMIGDLDLPIRELDEQIYTLLMSLVQLIWSPPCVSVGHQHAIGLALTVFAMLAHPYPGWKRQVNDPSDFHARAAEVYGYHKTHRYEHSKSLVVFGLLGLLRLEGNRFTKNDMNTIISALKQFGSIFNLRAGIHTLPESFSLKQTAIEFTLNYIRQALAQPLDADTFSAKVLSDLLTTLPIGKYWPGRLELKSNVLNAVTLTHSRHFCIEVLGVYLYHEVIQTKDTQKAFGEHPDPAMIDDLVSLSLGEHCKVSIM